MLQNEATTKQRKLVLLFLVTVAHGWSKYNTKWPLNFSSRGSDKVQLIVCNTSRCLQEDYSNPPPATLHSSLLTLINNVRSTSLPMPHSPLWQFSKSNANPVAGLCETALHNIDCHSQLGEWGKGFLFTSNPRLAQPAPKTQPAESDQWV